MKNDSVSLSRAIAITALVLTFIYEKWGDEDVMAILRYLPDCPEA